MAKLWVVIALLLLVSNAKGDGENSSAAPAAKPGLESSNYDKTEDRFLPGEEVVTPTGKKMKVWSARGPVRVSPPPQPFDDPEKQRLPDGIIVDGRGPTPRNAQGGQGSAPSPQKGDSFNIEPSNTEPAD